MIRVPIDHDRVIGQDGPGRFDRQDPIGFETEERDQLVFSSWPPNSLRIADWTWLANSALP